MKKVIIIGVLAAVLAAVYFLYPREKEEGRIKLSDVEQQEIEAEKTMATDEDMYKELSSYMYSGTVNYRDIYVIFKPIDLGINYSKYECVIVDQDDDPYSPQSIYVIDLNKDMGLNMSHVVGPYNSTLECSFENGELIMNGIKMEKHPLSEISDAVYDYGPKDYPEA